MVRIMIAEDEPPINRALQKLIEQCGEEYCIVASAYSGTEALDMLEEVRPDVVFTDIKMPGLDGIALAGQIRASFPETMIVVVTGYGDYENMRAMLRHNVYDYLLKPLKPEVLKELLKNISKDWRNRQIRKFSEIPLYAGAHAGVSAAALSDLQYQYMVSGVACMGAFPNSQIRNVFFQGDPWENEPDCVAYNGFDRWLLTGATNAEKYVVLGFQEMNADNIQAVCRMVFKETGHRYPLTMVFGKPVSSVDEVEKELWRLRSMLPLFIRIGESTLVMLSHEKEYLTFPDININEDKRTLLSSYMKRGDYSAFAGMIESIIADCRSQRPSQYTVTRQLKDIIQELEGCNPDKTCFDRYYTDILVDQAILTSFDYTSLLKNYLDICRDIFRIIETGMQHTTGLKDLVAEITYYLASNYDKPITGKNLEDHFGFSSAYINQIFKKKKGISPNKYLLQYRARKACELIQYDPGITAKELSKQLGIADELYLYKFFKKETGYTLSEYKTMITRE